MLLKQYGLGCPAHASYLVADPAVGTAVVVDPQRDIDQYIVNAVRHGCCLVVTYFPIIFMPISRLLTWSFASALAGGYRAASAAWEAAGIDVMAAATV